MALPSLSKKIACWKCAKEAQKFRCEHCGALQSPPASLGYFETLGLEPRLGLSEDALRTRFHALAKELHPDRFSGRPPPEPSHALAWTTLLNRAYQCLRDPIDRSKYLLELSGKADLKVSPPPFDLAEAYFEIQEQAGAPGEQARLAEFEAMVREKEKEARSQWEKIAERWDQGGNRDVVLKDLADHLVLRKYLASLLTDLERKKGSRADSRH